MTKTVPIACSVALTFLAACVAKRESYRPLPSTLRTTVWRTHGVPSSARADFARPEMTLLPELHRKADLGIAISGGGTRAAVATLGQFRVLKALGLLDRARYVSSDSGGTWLCGPYEYARPSLLPEDADHPYVGRMRRLTQDEFDRVFLGAYLPPEALHLSRFMEAPEGSYLRAVTQVDMRYSALFAGNGSESFSRVVSDAFLKPFGLGAPDKSFTWTRDWFEGHIAPEQSLPRGGLGKEDFYFAVPGRPFLIMNQAISLPGRSSIPDRMGFFLRNLLRPSTVPDYKAWYPVESTPLYTGVRPLARMEKTVGGGYVESFAYGARFDRWDPGTNRTRAVVVPTAQSPGLPPSMFSLGDAVGNSGAAVAAVVGGLAGVMNLEARHWHWPPASDDPGRDEQRLPHVDGGACDNSGIIALLARRTSRIICLSNAIFHLPKSGGRGEIRPWEIQTDVTALFGRAGSTALHNMVGEPVANHVLDCRLPDGGDALDDLAGELSERNLTGRPLVVCREYNTVPNARHELAGGQRVKICWVFLTFTRLRDGKLSRPGDGRTILERWITSLPDDARRVFTVESEVRKHHLKNFPAYSIVKENTRAQQLSALQANALAQFAAFCLTETGGEIRQGLDL